MRDQYEVIGGNTTQQTDFGNDQAPHEIDLNINDGDAREKHLKNPHQRTCSLCECFSTFFASTSGWMNIFQNQKKDHERSIYDSPHNSR